MINPLLSEALASIIRSILKLGAGYLIAKGVWSAGDASTYVEAAALALVGVVWSLWKTYRSRLKLVTAAAVARATEQEIVDQIARGVAVPSVLTLPNVVPVPVVK